MPRVPPQPRSICKGQYAECLPVCRRGGAFSSNALHRRFNQASWSRHDQRNVLIAECYPPHTTHLKLLTTHCSPHTTPHTLPTTHYSPHTAHHTLPITHCSTNTTHHTLRITHCQTRTAQHALHYPPHITHHTLPITHRPTRTAQHALHSPPHTTHHTLPITHYTLCAHLLVPRQAALHSSTVSARSVLPPAHGLDSIWTGLA